MAALESLREVILSMHVQHASIYHLHPGLLPFSVVHIQKVCQCNQLLLLERYEYFANNC